MAPRGPTVRHGNFVVHLQSTSQISETIAALTSYAAAAPAASPPTSTASTSTPSRPLLGPLDETHREILLRVSAVAGRRIDSTHGTIGFLRKTDTQGLHRGTMRHVRLLGDTLAFLRHVCDEPHLLQDIVDNVDNILACNSPPTYDIASPSLSASASPRPSWSSTCQTRSSSPYEFPEFPETPRSAAAQTELIITRRTEMQADNDLMPNTGSTANAIETQTDLQLADASTATDEETVDVAKYRVLNSAETQTSPDVLPYSEAAVQCMPCRRSRAVQTDRTKILEEEVNSAVAAALTRLKRDTEEQLARKDASLEMLSRRLEAMEAAAKARTRKP